MIGAYVSSTYLRATWPCLQQAVRLPTGSAQERIVGGVDASPGDFPYVTSLHRNGEHNCGASVLDASWLLTATHCVNFDTENLTILAGTVDQTSGGSLHTVTKVVINPDYNPRDGYVNDIALIKVEPELLIDNVTVAAARLPARGQDTPAGTPATIMGWGLLSMSHRDVDLLPNVLQKVDTVIVDLETCRAAYAPGDPVYESHICEEVPQPGKGACNGDSGSPMEVDGEVVGLASWQQGCGLQGYPTVYTRVSAFIDWIEENKK
ncbi:mite allergen Der f 3-like [Schistocerca serialis cubense]|uniref:mite allergen Der f 3-like n=1 Tax=Schistocerca serialis cubense TaxID=2023355 RepID=UPI00214E4F58|nr:mite allergen Der f 3-like [Schistocerca serialis cubense]